MQPTTLCLVVAVWTGQFIMLPDRVFLLNVRNLTDVKRATQKSLKVTGLKQNMLFIQWGLFGMEGIVMKMHCWHPAISPPLFLQKKKKKSRGLPPFFQRGPAVSKKS